MVQDEGVSGAKYKPLVKPGKGCTGVPYNFSVCLISNQNKKLQKDLK